MNKILTKVTAGLLVLSFGLLCIPESLRTAFANEIETARANTVAEEVKIQTDEFAFDNLKNEEVYILSENRALRNTYRKVFNLSDGTVLAEQYSTPVHYLDKTTGEYKEIDNTLVAITDDNGTYYKNAANAFDVKIQKNAVQGNSFIEISKDGYNIAFEPVVNKKLSEKAISDNFTLIDTDILQSIPAASFESAKINKIEGISSGIKAEFDYSAKKVTEPQFTPSVISEAAYNNFWNGANLQYSLNSSQINEVITINKQAEQYTYIFKMNAEGLSLKQQDDGSVLAYSSEDEQLFCLEAPSLTDALGNTSSAVSYEIIDANGAYYLKLAADSEWVNSSETLFPVKIQAGISVNTGEKSKNTFIETQDGAVLNMNNIALPPYYFLTSASLKYSYKGTSANSSFEICTIADNTDKSIDKISQSKKSTLVSAEENIANKVNRVYTQVKKLDISKITEDNISFGFIPASSNNDISVYADGANAAVLSLQYDLNVGLNPDAVMEKFESDCTTNYVNVYTKNLTSVIDCMSINSNDMPIQLQLVYNPTYDTYKSDLCTVNTSYLLTGYGKNFKLNLEQYCFRYDFDGNGSYEGVIYIDESGAVHKFDHHVRNQYGVYHLGCSDCNLTCVQLDTARFTIYKNELPYMYFDANRLQWIAILNKCLRIGYERVNNKYRIKKVYNCLEGGTYSNPSTTEAQSVSFSYNSNDLLSSMTSSYGETVSFSYDSNGQMTKVARSSLALASLNYDTSGRLYKVIGKQKLGYQFDYSNGNSVSSAYGVNTDNTTSSSISKATFGGSGTTKTVNITMSDQKTVTHQYGFNSSAKCESSYQGYLNYQNEKSPRSSVTVYSKHNEGKTHTSTSINYTEDFSQISNGSFESITGNSPTGWTVNTTNTGNNYSSRNGGNALWLTANSSASRSYNFNNHYKTSYVLGFFAEAWGHDCTLKVTLSGKSKTETFNVSYYGQYYAFEVFDNTVISNSGTIKFENLCSSHSLKIDNVTLSPVENYTESVWDGEKATQTYKQITPEGMYTCDINDFNEIKNENIEDNVSGTTTIKTNTFSENHLYLEKSVTTVKKGSTTLNTKTVQNVNTATSRQSTITSTGSDGKSLTTYESVETNIYGLPLKEIGINGEKTYYFYENTQNNYRLVKKISCINTTTVAAGSSHDSHTYDYVETYTYNSYGECSSISNGSSTNSVTDYHNGGSALFSGSGQSWKTDVNVYGNPTAIYESGNSTKQIEYTYKNNQNLSRTTYNRSSTNTSYADYEYDSYGNLNTISWYDKNGSTASAVKTADYSNTIDYSNQKQTVLSNGVSYEYQTNINNNPLNNKITVNGNNYNANYTYNSRADGLISNSSYNINGLTRTYTPQYNDLKQIVSETDGSDFKSEYSYDAMSRLSSHNVYKGSKLIISNGYSYDTNKTSGSNYTVNRITRLSNSVGYGYDYLGRITRLSWDRTSEDTISYDKYNRISSVMYGGYNGTWYSYSYDSNNNLTSIGKREPNGPPTTSTYITYSYNSKNQLTSYTKSGTTKYYTYDNLGNPVKYGVSSTSAADNIVWTQGTKLASGSYKGNSFSYKYNADGLRYEKTVNGVTTRQYLEGNRVIAEEEVNSSGTVLHTKYYIYDQTGIAGMVYDGSTYYFEKNLFGDVTTIYNTSGSQVANYTYDLWGNITSGGSSGVGKENPFRYRGYYYDNETGFYYLQSRYYDPEICRFISADNLELIPTLSQTAGQLNLYAYCNNNPVMYTDPSGEFVSTIIGAIFGAIWGGVTAALQGNNVWQGILIGAGSGALAGLAVDFGVATMGGSVVATVGGLAIAAVGGFAAGFAGDVASQMILEGKPLGGVSWGHAAIVGGITAFTNLLGVGISYAASGLGKAIPNNLNVFQKMIASLNPIHTPLGSWIGQATLGFGIAAFPNLPGFVWGRK